jgi:hypothetical protein
VKAHLAETKWRWLAGDHRHVARHDDIDRYSSRLLPYQRRA